MDELRLFSWNVNGIRSATRKGFLNWLADTSPDVVGLQETKISSDQLSPEVVSPPGYYSFFSHAERRGYSGVALYTKEKPLSVDEGLGHKRFDNEGRVLVADYGEFVLLNIYFPNGTSGEERLAYKLAFYDRFLSYVEKLRKKRKKIIICGDFNTAHNPIDLARPKENEERSGFLPVEREWMDKFVKTGYVDTFRHFCPDPHKYSWWTMRALARQRNIGWRIDYFFSTKAMAGELSSASIEAHVTGSDHCPVGLVIKV